MTSLTRLLRGKVCAAFLQKRPLLLMLPTKIPSPFCLRGCLSLTHVLPQIPTAHTGAYFAESGSGEGSPGSPGSAPRRAWRGRSPALRSELAASPEAHVSCSPGLPLAVRRRVQRGWGEGVPGNSLCAPGAVPCSWREGGVALPCWELLTGKPDWGWEPLDSPLLLRAW